MQAAIKHLKDTNKKWKRDPLNPAKEKKWRLARNRRNAAVKHAKRKYCGKAMGCTV